MDPQVVQTYRLTDQVIAMGIVGLTISFVGSPSMKEQPSDIEAFDVMEAIAGSVAAGGPPNQISVCDNALKQALDRPPYVMYEGKYYPALERIS